LTPFSPVLRFVTRPKACDIDCRIDHEFATRKARMAIAAAG
jgi:hypothetical protein